MAGRETSILGSGSEQFPDTLGSLLRSAREEDSRKRAEAINRLFQLYWRPVYAFVRKHGRTIEDAKDLTQEFLLELFLRDSITRYDPQKGRFRDFLKGAVRLFLAQARRSEARRSARMGPVVPLGEMREIEGKEFGADLGRLSEDEIFDKHLARQVMARALRVLKRELDVEGKEIRFEIYRAYDLLPENGTRPTYDSLAREMKVSVTAVRKHLEQARKRLRAILVRHVSECAATREEIAEELRRHRSCWRAYGASGNDPAPP